MATSFAKRTETPQTWAYRSGHAAVIAYRSGHAAEMCGTGRALADARYLRIVTEMQVHRSGNRFVIDASGSVFASLVNLVRGSHLAHEPSAQAETRVEFSELRSAIDKIDAQLPKRPNLTDWDALAAAAETIS